MLKTEGTDFRVHAPTGELVAAVEVKNRQNLTRDVARAFLENLREYGGMPRAPCFVLLSQDFGFAWHTNGISVENASPAAEFPMSDVVSRYWPREKQPRRLRSIELEFVVLQWLFELSRGSVPAQNEPERTLDGIGFLEALKGTTILSRASA